MSDNSDISKSLLIWLDDCKNTNDTNDTNAQQEFQRLNKNFKRVENRKEYDEYIKSQPADACIKLIVNGRLGKEIVPEIHSLTQIQSIYVFCIDQESHKKWALTYKKVKGVYVEFTDLIQALRPTPQIKVKHSIISQVSETEPIEEPKVLILETYQLDSTYMISDSCFDYLIRMKIHPNEKDDFISFCQEALRGNEQVLGIIREFQESYSSNQAVSWLYRDDFFHQFIDNIFKFACIDAMLPYRGFIRDVQKQLVEHKYTSSIVVYRSEIMSNEQFEDLKNFNGKIIAKKSFFLTNLAHDKALSYTANISSANESKRILYIIDANPEIANVKPFAKFSSMVNNNDQEDDHVLFMIGSTFKITEIQDETDGIINIKLALCANDDMNKTKELLDQLKLKYIDEKGETDLIGFGQFLCDLGPSMNAKNIFDIGQQLIRSCHEKLSDNDDLDRLRCYDTLGNIELNNNNLDASFEWYKKSFDIRKEKLQENDLNLAESYKNLAIVSLKKDDYKQALEYFQQLSIIWKQSFGEYCYNLIFCYIQLAAIYEKEENLMEALSSYYQALTIMTKLNYPDEAAYAALYLNLGHVRTNLKQYHLALGYYNTSLEIKLKIHSNVAVTYRSIAYVHEQMNNIQEAKTYFEKAADIYRQLDPPDNSNVTEIEECIRKLPTTTTDQS